MSYLDIYNNYQEYEANKSSIDLPHVSYCLNNRKVYYDQYIIVKPFSLFLWIEDFDSDYKENLKADIIDQYGANDWDEYVNKMLLQDYPAYHFATCYVYTGHTMIWNGHEYYVWENVGAVKTEDKNKILTNTINYDELYNHSLEANIYNNWNPVVAYLGIDDKQYDDPKNTYDILVTVKKDEHVIQDLCAKYYHNELSWRNYVIQKLLNAESADGYLHTTQCFIYSGKTMIWNGHEYYMWALNDGNDDVNYIILTDTIDFQELYDKSIEADMYNMVCPYVALMHTDGNNIQYTHDEKLYQWLVKVIPNQQDSSLAAKLYIEDFS